MSRGQRVALMLVAAAIAVAAFLVLRPGDEDGEAPPPAPTEASEQDGGESKQPKPDPPKPEVARVEVEGGAPVGGAERIEVAKGEEVRLVVSSDAPAQVHVHGYDLFEDAAPGAPARFSFPADLDGGFEVELEGTHVQIAELRVSP